MCGCIHVQSHASPEKAWMLLFLIIMDKNNLILQTNPNRFLQISFFIGTLFMFIFKKASYTVWGETWVWACCYQSVSGRNKCICCSSHALCYGQVRSCAIHNSFASYDGDVTHTCCTNKTDCPIFKGEKNPIL